MKTYLNSKNTTHRFLEGICVFLLFLAFLVPSQVIARPKDYINLGNINNFNFGTWTGPGSVRQNVNFCVASANDDEKNIKNLPPSASVMPYQVKVESRRGAPGDFYLYLNGDRNNTGNRRIRVTFEHSDQFDGNSYEQLSYDSWDTHSHEGQFRNCPNGNNSSLQLSISSSELAAKVAGQYSNDFVLTAIGGSSGTADDNARFSVDIEVQSSPQVQISSLDNMALGTHAGIGNIYEGENFCVHSTSGSYSLNVSSSNQDGSGNFYLTGGFGQIPYELFFTDSANGPGTVKVTNNTLGGFGNSADQFCNGVDNATLSISIQEQDLQQSNSGFYSDSLTILIAPQ